MKYVLAFVWYRREARRGLRIGHLRHVMNRAFGGLR